MEKQSSAKEQIKIVLKQAVQTQPNQVSKVKQGRFEYYQQKRQRTYGLATY